MELKLTWIFQILVAFHAYQSLGFQHVLQRDINLKPTRVIANVTVIDTPLVRAAQALAQQYSDEYLYNHVVRTWLFGALILSHNATLKESVDLEVHAIGSLLHDLGLVLTAPWITPDQRFEVDSGFAATNFVEEHVLHNHTDSAWDANRLQLLWDSVVLSSEAKFSLYKQSTVAALTLGVGIDLAAAPNLNVTQVEYDQVLAEFPRLNFLPGLNQTFKTLAATKPNSTWDSWQQVFGDAFVPHYSAVGHRIFDVITGL